MKRLSAGFLALSLLASTMQSNRAEAGVILIGSGIADELQAADDMRDGQLGQSDGDHSAAVVSLALGLSLTGGGLIILGEVTDAVFPAVFLMVLDANGALNQNILAQGLERAYPFIDNSEVLGNLASALKAKAPEAFVGQKYSVSLTESETRSILAASSMSEENIQKVVNDLK